MFLTKRDAKLATNFEDAFIVFNNASNKWQKELTNLKWLLDFVNNSEQSLKLTNKFISFGHESFYYSVAIILHERMVRKELAEGVSPEKLFKQNYSISNLKISDLNEEIIEKFLS